MFIKRYGEGNNIFIGFHGWSGDHRTFEPLIPFIPEDSSFYSYDLPGCGNSPEPENWDIETLTSTLLDSLEYFDNHPITFIGNCSGAIIGLLSAKKKMDLFFRLVLIDPFAYMPWYFSLFLNKSFGQKAYNLTFANPIGRRITNASLKNKRSGQTNLTKSFEEVNHNSVYKYLQLLDEVGNASRFKGINIPIDILYGENTFKAVKNSIEIWKEVLPQACFHELKKAGHLPIEEAPEQVSEILFKKN